MNAVWCGVTSPCGRRRRGRCHCHQTGAGRAGGLKGNVNSKLLTGALTRAERDDPALRVVGGNTYRYPVARDHLDSKTPHAAAQLGQYFMPGVHLHSVKAATVHRDNGALHVN